jgi:hypothetical protein
MCADIPESGYQGGPVNSFGAAGALRICLAALTWSVAGSALAAGAAGSTGQLATPATSTEQSQELDEVIVKGQRISPKPRTWKELQKPFDWLARLVGEFDIDGSVDLHARGRPEDLRKVSGRADCVGFGIGPGVQCDLSVLWEPTKGPGGEEIPGGISTLNPAVMLFGFEPVLPGVSWILVDSEGNAETSVGVMVSVDILHSRSKCVAIAGNCERLMQITADSALKHFDMEIDLRMEGETAVRFRFVMHRVPGSASVVYGRKQGKDE